MSQSELENKIATLLGDRTVKELVFHSASTGASNDIEQAIQTRQISHCPLWNE